MAACPVCHGEIPITDQNYGTLLSCPLCRAVFFVGWDGQPEITQQAGPADSAQTPAPINPVEFAPEEPPAFEVPGGLGLEMHTEALPSQEDGMPTLQSDFSQALEPEPVSTPSMTPAEPLSATSAFDSIEKYSNQTQETLPISYDVFIRGLDLPQQIQNLREAITDGRFAWEPDQIIARINNGELVIQKMSPIKASILIQRVKYADLEIEWRQHVLS